VTLPRPIDAQCQRRHESTAASTLAGSMTCKTPESLTRRIHGSCGWLAGIVATWRQDGRNLNGPCLAGKPPRRHLHRLSAPRVRVGPLLGRCDGVLVDSPTLLKPGQYRIKVATQLNRLMAEPFTYLDCLPRAFDQRFGVSGNFTVGSCHGYPLSLRVIVPAATRVCQFRPISDHC
jgi:hypothetical protein